MKNTFYQLIVSYYLMLYTEQCSFDAHFQFIYFRWSKKTNKKSRILKSLFVTKRLLLGFSAPPPHTLCAMLWLASSASGLACFCTGFNVALVIILERLIRF